jgi:hypothetical protein
VASIAATNAMTSAALSPASFVIAAARAVASVSMLLCRVKSAAVLAHVSVSKFVCNVESAVVLEFSSLVIKPSTLAISEVKPVFKFRMDVAFVAMLSSKTSISFA